VVVVGVVLIVAAACTRTDGTTPPDLEFQRQIQAARDRELSAALTDAPPEQKEILRDGVVTFDEYERAVLATIACLRDAGVEVIDIRPSDDGTSIDFTYGGVPDEGADALEEVFNRCWDRHVSYVADLYSIQNARSPSETAEHVRQAARCMRAAGMEVPPEVSYQGLFDLVPSDPEPALRCLREAGL